MATQIRESNSSASRDIVSYQAVLYHQTGNKTTCLKFVTGLLLTLVTKANWIWSVLEEDLHAIEIKN